MNNFNEIAIIERIKRLRTQFAGARGKSKFAKALDISPSTYNYYENNRLPPIDILLKICEVTGADLNWLLTGHKTQKNSSDLSLNITLLREIRNLLAENPELAEPISAFIDLLCQKKSIEKQLSQPLPQSKSDRPAWIPVLGRTAAGLVHFWDRQIIQEPQQAVTQLDQLVKKHLGKEIIGFADGTISVDLNTKNVLDGLKKSQANIIQICSDQSEDIVEFVQCEQVYQLYYDCFALRIDGDSMSPRINDGDIVIISPSVPVIQGQIGVVRVKNQIGVTCKLVRMTEENVHLIPINEKYETKIIPKKDLLWALAVLCHVSV